MSKEGQVDQMNDQASPCVDVPYISPMILIIQHFEFCDCSVALQCIYMFITICGKRCRIHRSHCRRTLLGAIDTVDTAPPIDGQPGGVGADNVIVQCVSSGRVSVAEAGERRYRVQLCDRLGFSGDPGKGGRGAWAVVVLGNKMAVFDLVEESDITRGRALPA